jgi:gluconate 2-dehydrogenase gamma chain
VLAGLPLALGVGAGSLTARAWDFVARSRATDRPPYSPRFFTVEEWGTVQALVDDVIPRDQRSGSATDAGVPEFMDFIMIDQPARQTAMRGGLAFIDHLCDERFDKLFIGCTDAERRSVLDDIAYPAKVAPGLAPAAAFFNSFRDLTASGFWSSKMGVEDLQYLGNKALAEWKGCPSEALEHLGVKYEGGGGGQGGQRD